MLYPILVRSLHQPSARPVRLQIYRKDTNIRHVLTLNHSGEHDVTIKVADEGGGIPRSKLADVWSYRGSKLVGGQCAAVPTGSDLIRASEASAGLGLPLSRLHCKFFGGTLHLTPMEGCARRIMYMYI